MIAAGANNISNIKLGNTQIKNIYLGNSGVWTDKTTFNYTLKEEIRFDDNYSIYHSNLLGVGSTLNKSVDGTNYTALHMYSGVDPNLNITVDINDQGFTQLNQEISYTDTIYKSDANKYQLVNNSFWYLYNTTNSHFDLPTASPNTLITNGELSGRLILNNSYPNTEFEISHTSPKKIEILNVYMGVAEFDLMTVDNNYGLYLHLNLSLEIASGTKQFSSISKFKLPYILVNKFMEDGVGIEYNFSDNIIMNSDEFIQKWSFTNTTITLDLYKSYTYTGSVISSYCEASIKNYNNQGSINISLDGQFYSNKIITAYNDSDIYFYNHTEYLSNFSAYNTAPVTAKITQYTTYIDYTLIDDYS